MTTIFELDASVLAGELGRLVTEWPSAVSPLVANSMGTATPRLDEDGGVAFVRLGPGHGCFSINGFQLDTTKGHTITMVVRNHSGSLGPDYPYPFRAYVDPDRQAMHVNWGLFIQKGTTGDLYYDTPGGSIAAYQRFGLGDDLIFNGMGWVVLSLVVSEEKIEVFKNGISAYSVARSGPLPYSEPHTVMFIAAGKGGVRGCNLDVAFFPRPKGLCGPEQSLPCKKICRHVSGRPRAPPLPGQYGIRWYPHFLSFRLPVCDPSGGTRGPLFEQTHPVAMGVPLLVHTHHLEACYAVLVAGPILEDLQVLHLLSAGDWSGGEPTAYEI